jgi:hypothetical protein
MLSLLTSSRFWIIIVLAASNAFSYFKGHHSGYLKGTSEIQTAFDAYKTKSIEDAMIEQVRRNEIEATLKTTNAKVTENYVSLQAATSTAVRALDSDRMHLKSALAAAHSSSAPLDTSTGLPTDASTEDRILGECFEQYGAVADDAQQMSDQLSALQAYVLQVVPK